MFTVESALSGSAGCMSMSYQLSNIISITLYTHRDFLVAQTVRNLPAVQETQVQSLGWEDPWRRKLQPTPVFVPGESHGQRSLVGYSPWGHKESNMTKCLTLYMKTTDEDPSHGISCE